VHVDESSPPLRDLWYRVVAIDQLDTDPRGGGGNISTPSPAIRARAYDESSPVPPAIVRLEWVLLDDQGNAHAYDAQAPEGEIWRRAISTQWAEAGEGMRLMVQAKSDSESSFRNLSRWLAPGTSRAVIAVDRPYEGFEVRLKVVNAAGHANTVFNSSHLN